MRARELIHRLDLLEPAGVSVDADGAPTPAWTEHPTISAELVTTKGEEKFSADGLTIRSREAVFRLRSSTAKALGVSTAWRARWDGEEWNVADASPEANDRAAFRVVLTVEQSHG